MSAVLVPRIEGRIQVVRGLRVMIDVDLAALYGVPTKRLNEQVKRNRDRFPPDFLFQLTAAEKAEVVANCDHLGKLKFSKVLPYAFTEHGAIQAANVLASAQAVEMGIYVVRASCICGKPLPCTPTWPSAWPIWRCAPRAWNSRTTPSAATRGCN
jgi:hypothetical protein